MDENRFARARNDLVKLIQEGNGIRERSTKLLKELSDVQIKQFDFYAKKELDLLDNQFSSFYKEFIDFDKKAGLFSETLAMSLVISELDESLKLPPLEDYGYVTMYAFHLSAHRETLRNLFFNAENKINNLRESINNRTLRFIAWVSLLLALISLGVAFLSNNSNSRKSHNWNSRSIHNFYYRN